MSNLLHEVRYAVRALAQSPGFAVTALLTIALAIGATAAMFAIVNGVLLRALPYRDADRLVRLYSIDPARPAERATMSLPDLADWQQRTTAFSATAAYRVITQVLLGHGDPQELRAAFVTDDFFAVLGAPMALGRALDASDAQNASRNVVISDGLWRSAFGGDPGVIGTPLLPGQTYTIVGVTQPELRFPAADVALWIPQSVLAQRAIGPRTRDNRGWEAIARLAPGVSVESALAQTRTVATQLATEYAASNERLGGAEVVPLLSTIVAQVERALFLVLGVVAFITLIACANVANLLLARGAARAQEVATRMALGASRWRIARQTLVESCVLALIGGALGVGIAFATVQAALALYGNSLPRAEDVQIDGRVLAFALAVSLAAAALFGWLPPRGASRAPIRAATSPRAAASSAQALGCAACMTSPLG